MVHEPSLGACGTASVRLLLIGCCAGPCERGKVSCAVQHWWSYTLLRHDITLVVRKQHKHCLVAASLLCVHAWVVYELCGWCASGTCLSAAFKASERVFSGHTLQCAPTNEGLPQLGPPEPVTVEFAPCTR